MGKAFAHAFLTSQGKSALAIYRRKGIIKTGFLWFYQTGCCNKMSPKTDCCFRTHFIAAWMNRDDHGDPLKMAFQDGMLISVKTERRLCQKNHGIKVVLLFQRFDFPIPPLTGRAGLPGMLRAGVP